MLFSEFAPYHAESSVYRNIIKFDLASGQMSLQAPGLFSSAYHVEYFNTSEGKIL